MVSAQGGSLLMAILTTTFRRLQAWRQRIHLLQRQGLAQASCFQIRLHPELRRCYGSIQPGRLLQHNEGDGSFPQRGIA